MAARGIDIPSVQNIIHYDFPAKPKIFIHRSGRTARGSNIRMLLLFKNILMDIMIYIL